MNRAILKQAAARAEIRQLSVAAAVVIASLPAAGCGSDGPSRSVDQMIAHTSTAMQVSATQEAKRHAAAEIALAEEKLAAARQAGKAGDGEEASRMIAEALVNLELAKAKAEAQRVKAELQRTEAMLGASKDAGKTAPRPK